MAVLSVDVLFDAAIRIQLAERSISITFVQDEVRIKFPTTRRLAEFLEVPHYYVLPYFAMMEQEELVTRAERVGILTTAKGSRKMIALMKDKYLKEMNEIIGSTIFQEIITKCLLPA
jgi:DNA-binding transcriptional regulator YhcF (GntR family)